jgi:hypothetical protein
LNGAKHAFLPPLTSRPNPLAVGRRLYVSVFSPGTVHCLDRITGAVIWRRRLPAFGNSLLHINSLCYVVSSHTLFAIHPDTGRVFWQFSPYGPKGETFYSAPVVRNGRLFIGDVRGYLRALDADSGRPIWRVLTSQAKKNDVNGLPLVDGNRVIVGNNAGRVLCLDQRTGELLWNQRVGEPCLWEISIRRNLLVVPGSRSLIWLNRQSGRLHSRHRFSGWNIMGLATKGRQAVALLSNGTDWEIAAFRDTRLLFRKPAQAFTVGWLPSGLLLETRFDGIGILDPKKGDRVLDIPFREECMAGRPAELDGHLYVLTHRGYLLALRWPPPSLKRQSPLRPGIVKRGHLRHPRPGTRHPIR